MFALDFFPTKFVFCENDSEEGIHEYIINPHIKKGWPHPTFLAGGSKKDPFLKCCRLPSSHVAADNKLGEMVDFIFCEWEMALAMRSSRKISTAEF